MKMNLIFLVLLFFVSCKNPTNLNDGAASTNSSAESELIESEEFPQLGGPTDVKITLTDLPVTDVIKIIGFYADQNFLADTVSVINGVIHYKKPDGLPQGLYYFSFPDNKIIQVFLGEDQEFEMTVTYRDIPNNVRTNSKENQLFYESAISDQIIYPQINQISERMKAEKEGSAMYNQLKDDRKKLENQRLAKIQQTLKENPNSLFAKYKYAGQNPNVREELPLEQQLVVYRKEFWDNVDFSDRRLLRTPVIGNKLKRYIKELTPQHQDSIVVSANLLIDKTIEHPEYFKLFTNWIILEYEPGKSTLMDSEKVFVSIVQKYFTPEKAFWQDTLENKAIQKRAFEMQGSLLGAEAPNVFSKDQNGQTQELLSKKADYLIVYMFNPDCDLCREETPKLRDFYNQNKNLVDVYAIALDTDHDKWVNYINKNNLNWTNVHDPSNRSIYAKYFVDRTPEIYVINKDRKIVGKNLKVFQIQTIIDRDKEKK
jgi:peroxiredoxin